MTDSKALSGRPEPFRDRTERDPVWTVRGLLEWTTGYFQEAGISSPRLDAEILLAHTLQKARMDLYLQYESPVSAECLKVYREYVRRRRKREPVAYITEKREFFSIGLQVDSSVLIPRPETEHLVEHAIRIAEDWREKRQGEPLRILEVGTGSGNIAVALARNLSGSWIVSVDISADAVRTAARNLGRLDESHGRVMLVRGDLLEWVRAKGTPFHMVVSNPPYVASEEWSRLSPEIRDHEPEGALKAGPLGTEIQERLLEQASNVLHANGTLVMEIGAGQASCLLEQARQIGAYRTCNVFPDYAGIPRVLLAEK